MLMLLSSVAIGCRSRVVSSTVNNTFVDVDGLLTAPASVVASYPTEELNLGNDRYAGAPQFLDGVLYTFSYHSDLRQWTTAWDQATGRRLWSVLTNVDTNVSPETAFTTDGTHLFFIRADIATLGEPGVVASIACLEKATGATAWQSTPTVASSYVYGVRSNIAVHIDEQSHTADRIYVIGAEERTSTTVPPKDEVLHPGIWIWDAATGNLQGRIDWVALSIHPEATGQLLCDGTTLYAGIPESASPTLRSTLAAFMCATNKALWTEQVSGEVTDLIKQGDRLMALLSNNKQERSIDVWNVNAGSFDRAERLWTRQIDTNPAHVAVDDKHVYVQGARGILTAFDLATGAEGWRHPFAPYKTPVTDGPDMGKLYDLYPDMTLTTTRDVLYVQDGGGLVAGLDPATGKELWSRRIAQVIWGQTHIENLFVVQPIDRGFLVLASNGTVDLWK